MRILSTLAFIILLASRAAMAGNPNYVGIAVNTTGFSEKTASELEENISLQVQVGFAAARLDLANITDTTILGRIKECADIPCLQTLIESSQLSLAVQVNLSARKATKKGRLNYAMAILAVRANPRLDAWREKNECQNCDEEEAKQQAFLLASEIGGRIAATASRPEDASRPEVATPRDPPPAKAKPVSQKPRPKRVPPPPTQETKSISWLPWALGGSGVLALGYGAWQLHKNGETTGDCSQNSSEITCKRYSSGTRGTIALVGGGALVVTGILWAMLGDRDDKTTISASLNHVALTLRF